MKFADKLVALDKLARHLGMFNDKIKLVGDKDNPLLLLIQAHSRLGDQARPAKASVDEYDRAA